MLMEISLSATSLSPVPDSELDNSDPESVSSPSELDVDRSVTYLGGDLYLFSLFDVLGLLLTYSFLPDSELDNSDPESVSSPQN